MDTPLISVIIPAYNNKDFLKYVSIPSVLAQTYSSWELIVVDDGSYDDTKAVVNTFAGKDKRVRYIYKENGGPGGARNVGIKNAEGKYVLFLDADDALLSTALAALAFTAEQGNYDMTACSTWVVAMPKGHFLNCYLDSLPSQFSLFRKDLFYRYGFFDETLYVEDGDFELSLRVKAREIGAIKKILINEPLAIYFRHLFGQKTDSKNYRKVQQSLLAIVKKFEAWANNEKAYFSMIYFFIGHFEAAATDGDLALARKYFRISWKFKPSIRTAIFYGASFFGRSFCGWFFSGANLVRKNVIWKIRVKRIEKKFPAAYVMAFAQLSIIKKTGVFERKTL
jgi:glycosyltransferase involved in cell wall biosynthesis